MRPKLKIVDPQKWDGVSTAELVAASNGSLSVGSTVGAQLANHWMAGGRNPRIWTAAVVLEEVVDDTLIGVVGRNYFPSSWGPDEPLAKSRHAVMLRCGDGAVTHKGKGTSFMLRKLESGTRLNMIMDMQKLELTVEMLGKLPGQILSSLTVEGMPGGELTLAIGFAAGGAAQRIRLVGCQSEKPEMALTGKYRKDLWDDDNVQKPLQLNVKEKERGALQAQQAEIAIAASLGGD